jgi:hypothetical protein
MQQADMRISALDHLAIELQHQAQHPMRSRMLGAKIERVVLDFSHQAASIAGIDRAVKDGAGKDDARPFVAVASKSRLALPAISW